MLLYVCSFADRQILSLLVAPIKRDFGMSNTQIGLLQGLAFAVLYTLLGLPLGWLADRMSRVSGAGETEGWRGCGLALSRRHLPMSHFAV